MPPILYVRQAPFCGYDLLLPIEKLEQCVQQPIELDRYRRDIRQAHNTQRKGKDEIRHNREFPIGPERSNLHVRVVKLNGFSRRTTWKRRELK